MSNEERKEENTMNMMDYIHEQPEVFARVLENRATLMKPFVDLFARVKPERMYIIASGSSLNASLTAAPFVEAVLGMEITVAPPSSLPVIRGERPLICFVSQGGNSTNTIAAIEALKEHESIALTGNPEGRINQICRHYMEIPCGPETVGPKTKGYTITILTLYLMALEAARQEGILAKDAYAQYIDALNTAGSQYADNVKSTVAWFEAAKDDIKSMSKAFVVGKGQEKAVAIESALKILETLLVPAVGYEFEEYLHGPISAMDETLSGFYLLPQEDDADYARCKKLALFHRSICPAVYTVGMPDSSDPRDCVLKTSGKWYTKPFESVLLCQVLSARVPEMNGIEDKGMAMFKRVDQAVGVKYKGKE